MPSSYRQVLIDLIGREAKPIEKFSHQPRLYALAHQIGANIPHDDDILFAAAWLHDLGVFIGHRPEDLTALTHWDHVAYVLEKAPAVLTDAGFPVDKIPAVLEAIRTHQPHDEPTAIEGTILRDADILEQLGAIAILRTVCKVGRDSRFHTFTDAVVSLRKALITLPPLLKLQSAQILAYSKVLALQRFLHDLDYESYGAL